jgi:hypothetical protein
MSELQHRDKLATSRRHPKPWQAALCSIALGLLIGAAIVALGVWGSGKL